MRDLLQVIVMVTTAAALLATYVGFVAVDFVRSRTVLSTDLASLAEIVGSNSGAALLFGDHDAARDILSALAARRSIVGASLYTNDGRPFAVYPQNAPAGPVRPRFGLVEVRRPIVFRDEVIGSIYIASDLREVITGVRRFALVAALITAITLVLARLISSRMQRMLSDPILELARFADRVRTAKNYALRAKGSKRAVREIDLLTSAFDDMLVAIEERDDHLETEVEARTAELERARDEAERLGRHHRTVLNTAGEGIFGLDGAGVATFINVSAARMLGYSVEELIGRSLHTLIHDEEQRATPAAECRICSSSLEPSLRTGSNVSFVTRDGRAFPIEFTASRMQDDPGARGVVVTFRDVTERMAIERMKDEFVSTVSHELRTPLTSVHGALGIVASGLAGEITPRAQRMLAIAVSNTDRLGRLINEILDLEKMSSGRVDLQPALANASAVVEDAINVVQAVAEGAGIRITHDEAEAALFVDRDRIVQTLTNLLGNAIKFSSAGSAVHVSGSALDGSYTFSVSDTGRGIPEDKLEMVFERFKQVDASDSRDKGGTGLGLAICRSIVHAHGGRIWAESIEGRGSTFRFVIPLKTAIAAPMTRHDVAPAAVKNATTAPWVLVVEDDRDLSGIIVTALEESGVQAMVAHTGSIAIEKCERDAPSAIILDIELPDIDGFAVVDWMRRQEQLRDVPLFVYSARELDAADVARLHLGPTQFLTKSRVPLPTLTERVVTIVEGTDVRGAA